MRSTYRLTNKPPSTNHLFANVQGVGRVKSREYKMWIKAAVEELRWQKSSNPTHEGNIDVQYLCERNSPLADIGNLEKPLSDILVTSGIIKDDRFIDSIFIAWGLIEGVQITISDGGGRK